MNSKRIAAWNTVVLGLAVGALGLALGLAVAGCGSSGPTAPDQSNEPRFTLIEGDDHWDTNSVSWEDSATGLSRFAFISVARQASTDGPSHFLYSAQFHGCNDENCFPGSENAPLFREARLSIFNLDWSRAGGLVAFEGKRQGEPTYIYTMQGVAGATPRQWVAGFEPTFTPNAGLVVYVDPGREEIRSFNSSSGGGFTERGGLVNVSHPAVSPDGLYIAYSARDGERGQRIFVFQRNTDLLADAVSFPDHLPGNNAGDGTDDDFPTWSPRGVYVAYRTKIRENTLRDAVFITRPGAEPENPDRLVAIEPGRQMTYLRWSRNGQLLLLIIDGDVYVYPLKEPYRSQG